MSEYLKREDVRRAVLQYGDNAAIAAIDELPTVEIIHCRECKYYNKRYAACGNAIDSTIRLVLPNWFCGDGRRKEGTA